MQLKGLLAGGLAGGLALTIVGIGAISCKADFLHRAYQGSFTENGYTYTVSTDGSIDVSKKKCPDTLTGGCTIGTCSSYVLNCEPPIASFKDLNELDTVLSGLKKVSDAIHSEENSK